MSWGSQGWDSLDDYGPSKDNSNNAPRKFFVPANVTKRIMFLSSVPFTFWEHSLYEITRSGKDKEVCLKKNRIGQECPLCDKEMWPSFIGYFSIIDLGDVKRNPDGSVKLEGWTSDRGVTYQFGKKLLGAKRGGRDKPGILHKINRMAQRNGDLKFSVYDVYRSGNKVESCGDEWEFVDRVDPEPYLAQLGASVEQYGDLNEVNYIETFKPKTVEELNAIVNGGGSNDFGTGFSTGGSFANYFSAQQAAEQGAQQGQSQSSGEPWKKW